MSNLEKIRCRLGLTQNEIAALVGVSVSAYSQYENGIRSIPKSTAESIAKIVGSAIDEIFLPSKFTVSKFIESREVGEAS